MNVKVFSIITAFFIAFTAPDRSNSILHGQETEENSQNSQRSLPFDGRIDVLYEMQKHMASLLGWNGRRINHLAA